MVCLNNPYFDHLQAWQFLPPCSRCNFLVSKASFSIAASSLASSNFPEFNPTMVPNSISSARLTSSSLSVSTSSLNVVPLQPAPLVSGTMPNLLPNKAPASTIPISIPSSNFPALAPSSTLILTNAGLPSVANTLNSMSGPATLTPGQLLQPGPASVSSPQLLQTTQKDVEVVQVLPKLSSGTPAPVVTEAQPSILPLPTNTRSHKLHNLGTVVVAFALSDGRFGFSS